MEGVDVSEECEESTEGYTRIETGGDLPEAAFEEKM
jgi:hypothetical protein